MTYRRARIIWITSIRIRSKSCTGCKLEPSLADAKEGERFQFVRMGYYCKDRESGRFNRIVTLKDSFAKTLKK